MKTILILTSLLITINLVNANEINWNNFLISHRWNQETIGALYFKQDFDKNTNIMCEDKNRNPLRLTMIDQESNEIYRISDKKAIPPSYKNTYQYDFDEYKNILTLVADNLKKYCLDINLAPILDAQIGNRQYSKIPYINNVYAKIFSQSMREANIIPTWKHFPGLNKIESKVYNTKYDKYYKNIYGEGVIDSSTYYELLNHSTYFENKEYNLLMFSIAIYPHVYDKPIVFSKEMISLARQKQPNSLLIPDDLSELHLKDEDIVFLFKNFDLLMFTSPQDIERVKKVLEKAFINKEISLKEIQDKTSYQNIWRNNNKLELIKDPH